MIDLKLGHCGCYRNPNHSAEEGGDESSALKVEEGWREPQTADFIITSTKRLHHSANVRTVLMLILTVTLTLTANGRFVVNQSSESEVEGQVYHEPPPPQWGSALRPSSVSSTSAWTIQEKHLCFLLLFLSSTLTSFPAGLTPDAGNHRNRDNFAAFHEAVSPHHPLLLLSSSR